MNPRAVVLLSGGLDSATCLAIAKNLGYECHALTINYGQRHRIELDSAARIAQSFHVYHKIISVDLTAIGGSALTDDLDVPKSGPTEEIPITYVPARNTIFLSLALGFAEVIGAEAIIIGANAVDYSGYPDCRPEFIESFANLAQVATKAGIEGKPIRILAPIINLTKSQIIQAGLDLGVDYAQTHSCYDPNNGKPCQKCDSCRIRIAAFQSIGLIDPAL
jgi:7-cyano-7-deazaguanine synthase